MKKHTILTVAVAIVVMFGGIAFADLTDGLVAYYPFNGNANDESGNGYHGVLLSLPPGHPPEPRRDMCGNPDSAFYFDGVDDYINVGNPTLDNFSDDLTFTAWIKAEKSDDKFPTILVKIFNRPYGTDETFFFGFNEQSTGFGGEITTKTENDIITNYWEAIEVKDLLDQWHHLAMTYNKSAKEMRLYLDGELKKLFSDFGGENLVKVASRDILIGACIWEKSPGVYAHGYAFKGLIDEVRIYNRELSEDEIYQLYDIKAPCICDPRDSDDDGVPDVWDECPDTPVGSAVYSNGCPAECWPYEGPFIYMLEPSSCYPNEKMDIIGYGFGVTQGSSLIHIGSDTFDSSSAQIQDWDDTGIKMKVSKYDCGWWGESDEREQEVWVTVNGDNSNTKILTIIKPDECTLCNDKLWNIRVNAQDFFHSNEAWVRPWRKSQDDGWGRFERGYAYDFKWHNGPYTQSSGSVSSLSWNIDYNGSLAVTGSRDHQWHAWTYVYVEDPITLYIPFTQGNGTSVPTFFLNYDFDTPHQYINQAPIILDLVVGWNRIDITGYNQNDSFVFHLNYDLAGNVSRISSTDCSFDYGCICPYVYSPVCGVDGNTYTNRCSAKCNEVEVAYPGDCSP